MSNLKKAQNFVIGQCLSDYPPSASYSQICNWFERGSKNKSGEYTVTAWEPFEDVDVIHVMDNMVSAVERLLNDHTDVDTVTPEALAARFKWDGEKLFKFMLAALTDSNYHAHVKVLEQAWEAAQND